MISIIACAITSRLTPCLVQHLQVAPLVIWRNVLMCIAYATWWAFDERFFRGGSEHMGFSRGRFSHGHGNVPIAREPFPWRLNPVTWSRVVFLAIGPGFACSWLQTLAQAQVDAAEAQVLMSTTPLWGAAWAFGMMGERMTALGWVGAGRSWRVRCWSLIERLQRRGLLCRRVGTSPADMSIVGLKKVT